MSALIDYSARVAALFEAAPDAGVPDGPGWVAGEAREPLSATHVRFYLRAEAGRVVGVRYLVRGCPHTLAAAALAAGQLRGLPVADLEVDLRAIGRELDVPTPKLGRLFTVQDAIRLAALQLDRGQP